MPIVLIPRHIFYCGLTLLAFSSCEKAADPIDTPVPPSPEPAVEVSTPPSPSPAEEKSAALTAAQQKLEAQSYYTEENVAAATALIESLPPATRQSILDNFRQGKKIDAVKLIREVEKTSLAISKLAVEMIAISEGVDPGIY